MIPKLKKISRLVAPKKKYDFFSGPERMRVRSRLYACDYEFLPLSESMHAYLWRGRNCRSDNTRFGFCYSRKIVSGLVKRFLNSRVGDDFDSMYSDICNRFHGYDLEHIKYLVFMYLDRDKHRFGTLVSRDYGVESGKIVKHKR